MMGKISLYGTVIPIILILFVGFILIGGWKFLLLIAGIAAVGKLLSKFLSEAWTDPILFILFIAGMHYLIQDVFVTMMLAFSIILVRLAGKFIKNKKIEGVLAFLITFSAALILEYSDYIFHTEVEVSEAEVDQVEQDFEAAYDVVEEAVISVDEEEKRISLSISADRLGSRKEVEKTGETFAKMVSAEVSEIKEIEVPDQESYGELFQDYDLQIYIKNVGNGNLTTGSKGPESAEISWYTYDID